MTRNTEPQPKVILPPLARLILWLGRPLGIDFVPEHHSRVVFRMGKYSGCKGPGLIYYNKLTETLGPLVYSAMQVKDFELDNIMSRDVIPVKMTVRAAVAYDAEAGPEWAAILTSVPRATYLSLLETYLRWALLALANQYNATELTQAPIHTQLAAAARDRVESELDFLGLKIIGSVQVLRVELPAGLAERHEQLAQRRASILAGTEFHPAEYRRALVAEVIEHLARSGGGESFVNFGEMLEAYAAERDPQLPPASRVLEHRPPPADEPAQQRPSPTENRGPAEPRSGPQRPKSRL